MLVTFQRSQNSLYSVTICDCTFWYSCGVCVAVQSRQLGLVVRAVESPSERHMHSKHLALIEGERPRRFNRSQERISSSEFDRFLETINVSIELPATAPRASAEAAMATA